MESSSSGIPIIDLSEFIVDDSRLSTIAGYVAEACDNIGCFYITNHGIESSLINSLFYDLRRFFMEPLEYKKQYELPDYSLDRGYFPFESQNVNSYMGKPDLPNDPVEKLAFGPPYRCVAPALENLWPDRPSSLRETVTQSYYKLRELSDTVLRAFAVALNAPDEEYFHQFCHDAPHSLKAHYYPGNTGQKPLQDTRFAEHFDITPFTIINTRSGPGSLQVKKEDEWVCADPIEGAMFIIIGDVMRRWTNGKWKATVHRVDWPDNGKEIYERISIQYFLSLKSDAVLECIPSCCTNGQAYKDEPILYQDYFLSALNRLSGKY